MAPFDRPHRNYGPDLTKPPSEICETENQGKRHLSGTRTDVAFGAFRSWSKTANFRLEIVGCWDWQLEPVHPNPASNR